MSYLLFFDNEPVKEIDRPFDLEEVSNTLYSALKENESVHYAWTDSSRETFLMIRDDKDEDLISILLTDGNAMVKKGKFSKFPDEQEILFDGDSTEELSKVCESLIRPDSDFMTKGLLSMLAAIGR